MHTVILDNGSHQMKVGYSENDEPRVVINAILKTKNDRKRVFVADQLDELLDRTSLYFDSPFEHGYLLNWDKQLQIWDRVFGHEVLDVKEFPQTRLLLTDANCISPLAPDAAASTTAESCFEIYQFHSLAMTSAPACVAEHHYLCGAGASCLVIDAGHSFTHIVPFHNGRPISEGVVRVDVGGKLLTNQLKEWVSYRQLNMMDETYVIGQCKEDCCFVSLDFARDMRKCVGRPTNGEETLLRDYILPDFVSMQRGQMQMPSSAHSERQKLRLGVERFALPEILFHPSDVEIPQSGLAEAICQSLEAIPAAIHGQMLKNVLLIGGSAKFPNLDARLSLELRSAVDDVWDEVSIQLMADPVTAAWKAASELSTNDSMKGSHHSSAGFVTKAEYEEHGAQICRTRFGNYADMNLLDE